MMLFSQDLSMEMACAADFRYTRVPKRIRFAV
jgi:hypothetical protein